MIQFMFINKCSSFCMTDKLENDKRESEWDRYLGDCSGRPEK